MNRAGSMSLRARINSFAKKYGVSPQLALQGFFIERFLARIEKSEFAENLAVKGGTLMCAILGLPYRTTMDIDTTVIGMRVDEQTVVGIVDVIASVDVGDGVAFRRVPVSPTSIAKDDEYGGWSIPLMAEFGTIRLPVSIDVTYGDVITPKAAVMDFPGLLDDSLHIHVLAYTVETLMAEKIQSILKRGVATTRPRDFYDLYRLFRQGGYDPSLLAEALRNTLVRRNSERYMEKWREIVDSILTSDFQKQQWHRYQERMAYARDISFVDLIGALSGLLESVNNQ